MPPGKRLRRPLKEKDLPLLERIKCSDGVTYDTILDWALKFDLADVDASLERLEKAQVIHKDEGHDSHPTLIKPTPQAWQV